MEFHRARKKKKSLNLTPLIDIIFLLVVFFLLTSEFVLTEVVELNIADVKSAQSDNNNTNGQPVLVVLTEGDSFIYSGQKYNLSLLSDIVGEQLKEDSSKSIILTNKEGVTVQELVKAMDSIKFVGGYNISIVEGSG